jgi:hypothetical protein
MATTKKSAPNTKYTKYIWAFMRPILFWTIASMAILALLLVFLAMIFEKSISKAAIAALREQLRTELTVDDVSLSLIRGFPRATLSLKGVKIKGYGGESNVVEVEVLALKCSIFSLLTGNYSFHTVELSKGDISLYRATNGLTNFDIFTPKKGENDANLFPVSRLQLTDVRVHYQDETFWQKMQLNCLNIDLRTGVIDPAEPEKGDFYYLAGDLISDYVVYSSDSFLVGNAININTTINYLNDSAFYRIDKSKIIINGSTLQAHGSWGVLEDSQDSSGAVRKLNGLDLDVQILTAEGKLSSLAPMLPYTHRHYFAGWESGTKMYATIECLGQLSADSVPVFNALLGMRSGKLEHDSLTGTLRDVNFELFYTNRDEAYDEPQLKVSDFSARLAGSPINFDYIRSGVFNPHISMNLSGTINLAAMYKFISSDISAAGGTLRLDSLRVDGFYADMLSPSTQNRVQLLGKATFGGAAVAYRGNNITLDKGDVKFRGNSAAVEAVSVVTAESNINVSGNIGNLLPFFLADSDNAYQAQLLFNLALQGDGIDVGEWQKILAPASGDATPAYWAGLGDWLHGKLQLRLHNLAWGKMLMQQVVADVLIDKSKISAPHWQADWAGGKLEAFGLAQLLPSPTVSVAMKINQVEAAKWLDECHNFGQAEFTNKQIAGLLMGNIAFSAAWDTLGNWRDKNFVCYADLIAKNGELTSMPAMKLIGSNLRINDFEKINFVDFYAQFKIENRILLLPNFFLRGHGYNLMAVVQSDFDKNFDYQLKFNSSSVLLNRIKANRADMEAPVRSKEDGILNLYLRATGNITANNVNIRLGKSIVKTALYQESMRINSNFKPDFEKEIAKISAQASADGSLVFKLNTLIEPDTWEDLPLFGEEQ